MTHRTVAPTTIDDYIAVFDAPVRKILTTIRATIAAAAPDAREVISYRMPAFAQHGILLFFAAFQHHIGVYPPVSGDPGLERALAPYQGPKGNLQFPLDRPMPYDLIRRIAALRVKQDHAKAAAAAGRRRTARTRPPGQDEATRRPAPRTRRRGA